MEPQNTLFQGEGGFHSGHSTAVHEDDASFARERLEEACEFAAHVEAITQLHFDTRKMDAFWLVTKSMVRALDFDATVENPMKLTLLAGTAEAKKRDNCEKLTDRDHFTTMTGQQ